MTPRKDTTGMCRKHRRCRGASTSKAATRERARRYRARRREAATAAAEPTAPASTRQDTAVTPEQTAGGDVTPNQPAANPPKKSASARRIAEFAKQERAEQARQRETSALLADAEEAAAAARQQNQARAQKAWEQRHKQRQEQTTRKPRRAQGDVTRGKRRHTGDPVDGPRTAAGADDRMWTVDPSPVPSSPTRQPRHTGEGRDTGRVGPVSGEGNLTLVSPQGPLHISMSGRHGHPEVAGDVTPASDGNTPTSATRQKPKQTRQPRRHTTRQGDVTDRPTASGTSTSRANRSRQSSDRNRPPHDSNTGPADVVGDGHITVTGARPGQVTRVTNHAAPGAHVNHQSTGHVHGASVTVTGGGEDNQRARDIARNIADRVHRAMNDTADALGDVTHNEPGHHTNTTSRTQAIQAPHIHNSRVHRDH